MPLYKHKVTGNVTAAHDTWLVGMPYADMYEQVADESPDEQRARERAEAEIDKVVIEDDDPALPPAEDGVVWREPEDGGLHAVAEDQEEDH
jgi:hypothetical protein